MERTPPHQIPALRPQLHPAPLHQALHAHLSLQPGQHLIRDTRHAGDLLKFLNMPTSQRLHVTIAYQAG